MICITKIANFNVFGTGIRKGEEKGTGKMGANTAAGPNSSTMVNLRVKYAIKESRNKFEQ